MPVRRKTLLVTIVTFAAFLGIIFVSSRFVILSRLAAAERESIRVYFAAALVLAGIAVGGIVQLLLEKSILSRLAAINASVEGIALGVDQNNLSVRTGRDELAMLANAVHQMIDAVHRSQKQRDEIEARHRMFMNNLPAIAAMKDESGRYLYFNEPMAKTFNLNLDYLEKPMAPTWMPPEVAAHIRSHELEVLRLLRPMRFEEVVPTPDGAEHYWLTLRFPLTGPEGQILIGMVALDITDRKRAEAELSRARRKSGIGLSHKSRISGQREPRNSSAHKRRDWHDRPGARYGPHPRAAGIFDGREVVGPRPAFAV